MPMDHVKSQRARFLSRRRWIRTAASGTVLTTLGSLWVLSDDRTREARAQQRPDGRPRLPEGQRVLEQLRPMGGVPGDPRPSAFRLRVRGEVDRPFTLSFEDLLALPQTTQRADVHCVTGWSVLGARWRGIRFQELAERARVTARARHVIFEGAHGYTANVPMVEAMRDNVMLAIRYDDRPLSPTHGGPVRALVPDLYFWKSAKWLTGVRFVLRDDPGYWEQRGYHNLGNPWKGQRYG